MKRALSLLILLASVGLPVHAAHAVPQFVTYAGHLSDGTAWGQSLPGVTLTFALYDAETGGARLWEQTFADVVVEDGAFSVVLGDGTDANANPQNVTDVFAAHDAMWAAVAIAQPDGDGEELGPRQAVGSVPYAVQAATSDRADRVEVRYGTKRYSINAIYRGSTSGVAAIAGHGSFNANGETRGRFEFPDASTVGYAAAKAACEVAIGSPTAHMCTAEEMSRGMQVGNPGPPVDSWVTNGIRWEYFAPAESLALFTQECSGWLRTGTTAGSPTWERLAGAAFGGGTPDRAECQYYQAIACCD